MAMVVDITRSSINKLKIRPNRGGDSLVWIAYVARNDATANS
jgi:hypothetical protein